MAEGSDLSVKIFISHASADTWVARQIAKEIESRGAATWVDAVDVETGDEVEARMRAGLAECSELLVLLSPRSVERPYVWMEIGAAWIQDKRVVGILHTMTRAELVSRDGTPALLKGIALRDLNDLDEYLDELERRIARE